MRQIAFGLALVLALPLGAQETLEFASADGGNVAFTNAVTLHGPGVRFDGPPKAGAPYSAEAVTETVQLLGDGNRIVRKSSSKVYRDNQGRTRREDKLDSVGPWAVAGEAQMRIFINDPVAGIHWVLEPETKTARKLAMPTLDGLPPLDPPPGGPGAHGAVSIAAIAPPPGGAGTQIRVQEFRRIGPSDDANPPKVEDLGSRMIEGVEATGTRTTRTIPAGEIGNERPIEVVFERWHSDELGLDVMTKRKDPRAAETTYTLTNIQRTEPLPGLFEPPPDYTVAESENVFIRRLETKQ